MPKASELAIKSVKGARNSFCKFLSANDTGATGGHQSGILVSKSASGMMFQEYLPTSSPSSLLLFSTTRLLEI